MPLKIRVTYKNSIQISPDDFDTYTEVLDFEENQTLKEIFNIIVAKWQNKNKANVEIQFKQEN